MKLSNSQHAKLTRALSQHDRHKNCYFWKPGSNASTRRRTEEQNTWTVGFTHNGTRYEYQCSVECSCKNYYYRGEFQVDGEKKTRAAFAKLLK